LGGSHGSKIQIIRNTFIIFLISGFWHGANWTFIIWGAIHAILFLPLILSGKNRKYTNTVACNGFLPNIKEIIQMCSTFFLVLVGWIFFRSESIGKAFLYFSGMFNKSLFSLSLLNEKKEALLIFILIIVMLIMEWLGRKEHFCLSKLGLNWAKPFRLAMYLLISSFILMFIKTEGTPFIYFQF